MNIFNNESTSSMIIGCTLESIVVSEHLGNFLTLLKKSLLFETVNHSYRAT
jgi:hypothetical protein